MQFFPFFLLSSFQFFVHFLHGQWRKRNQKLSCKCEEYCQFFLWSSYLLAQSNNTNTKTVCSICFSEHFSVVFIVDVEQVSTVMVRTPDTRLISLSKTLIVIRHRCSKMSVLNLCECSHLSSSRLLIFQSKLFLEKTIFDRHCFTSKEDQSRYFSLRNFFFWSNEDFFGRYISRYNKNFQRYIIWKCGHYAPPDW